MKEQLQKKDFQTGFGQLEREKMRNVVVATIASLLLCGGFAMAAQFLNK